MTVASDGRFQAGEADCRVLKNERGPTRSPRCQSKSAAIACLDDQQIVRIEDHAGLNRRHGDCRSLSSIRAVIERLVCSIEMELKTARRELVVARGFEDRSHVHARSQPTT